MMMGKNGGINNQGQVRGQKIQTALITKSINLMQDKYKNQILQGDAQDLLDSMPADLVNLVITSPPYFGCRVYGNDNSG